MLFSLVVENVVWVEKVVIGENVEPKFKNYDMSCIEMFLFMYLDGRKEWG